MNRLVSHRVSSMLAIGAVGALVTMPAAAGVVSFGGNYFQDFNGLGTSGAETISGSGPHAIEGVLGSTGMLGWYGANFAGSSSNTEFKAHNGSLSGSAGRGVVFFGTDGSSDRALGALPTSNQVSSFGVVLTNTTADTFVGLDISYIGEQWRAGGAGIPNVLSFSYGFGTSLLDATLTFSALDFSTPFLGGGEVAVNGNDSQFQTSVGAILGGIVWNPGESIVLRWDAVDLPGQDNGLAIDDLLVVGVIPAPGAVALLVMAGLAGRRRR